MCLSIQKNGSSLVARPLFPIRLVIMALISVKSVVENDITLEPGMLDDSTADVSDVRTRTVGA